MKIFFTVVLLSVAAWSQCNQQNAMTVCQGPVVVVPPANNTLQSGIILVDISLPAPPPAASQYILSIVNGTIQESDNNGNYHTLMGPAGPQGQQGVQGTSATVTVGQTFTTPAGTPATVTNSGSSNAAVLNFSIPQGSPGVVVGNTLTVNVSCPKGSGTIQQGWVTKGCKFVITNIQ